MKGLTVVCLSVVLASSVAPDAFGWGAVHGAYGGAAYRGPMGGTALRGPGGAAAYRGPAGGAARPGASWGAPALGPPVRGAPPARAAGHSMLAPAAAPPRSSAT